MTACCAASLKTIAVAYMSIVTGSGPQPNVLMPPSATASATAAEVHEAAVPLAMTRSGEDVSTAWASGGIGATPPGFPAGGYSAAAAEPMMMKDMAITDATIRPIRPSTHPPREQLNAERDEDSFLYLYRLVRARA